MKPNKPTNTNFRMNQKFYFPKRTTINLLFEVHLRSDKEALLNLKTYI